MSLWENHKNKDKKKLVGQLKAESQKFTWGEDVPDKRLTVTQQCIERFEATLAEAERRQGAFPADSRDWLELSLQIGALRGILEDLKQELQVLENNRRTGLERGKYG